MSNVPILNMKVILPSVLNPISRRKDRSVLLKFDTRELSPEETLSLMALEGTEGWIQFSPNQEFEEVPNENAETDTKSPSERLRAVMYILYKQAIKKGKFVGLFQTYYDGHMEKIIDQLKEKIEE